MLTKICFKCGVEKPLTEFYKHSQMKDGRVNKCKDCNKRDVRENREERLDHYREYDKKRGNRQSNKYRKEYKERFPNKYRAHNIVNNAIRDKKLFKEGCEVCGAIEGVHAHHSDYLRPLNVVWLCAEHHSAWHKENGEGFNPF